MFVFSVSLMISKLTIISFLRCLLSKLKTHSLIDLSLNGNGFIYLLISVNVVHLSDFALSSVIIGWIDHDDIF